MYNLHLTPEQIEIRDMVRDFATKEIKPLRREAGAHGGARSQPARGRAGAGRRARPARRWRCRRISAAPAPTRSPRAIVAEELGVRRSRHGRDPGRDLAARPRAVRRADDAGSSATAGCRSCMDDDRGPARLGARRSPRPRSASTITAPRRPRRATITATRSGNDYVLNGTSRGVANAPVASLIAVSATTDAKAKGAAGMVALIVPRGAEGMSVKPLPQAASSAAAATSPSRTARCRPTICSAARTARPRPRRCARLDAVPLRHGHQPRHRPRRATRRRSTTPSCACRAAGRSSSIRRSPRSSPSGAVRLEIARNAIWAAAWALDHPEALSRRQPVRHCRSPTIAHIHTAEAIYRAAKDCAECFGAMSVMRDMPLHKYVEDARMLPARRRRHRRRTSSRSPRPSPGSGGSRVSDPPGLTPVTPHRSPAIRLNDLTGVRPGGSDTHAPRTTHGLLTERDADAPGR